MITLTESRYARQELISWWDQDALASSRVLVVGAGALGNEIVKNLALLGVGAIDIVDMDLIEHSNLARCAMFRDSDEGRPKASTLATAASELNPGVEATAHIHPIARTGLAWLQRFDLVIAGLDNREARLWLCRACRKLGMTWIDGAIEGLRGAARVFLPEGPCYECTLGETDRQIMAARRSCSLLRPEEMLAGKVPTNATTAAIIAGIQVQEATKLLVGRADLLALRNQAFVYTGDTLEAYVTGYTEDEWCPSHDRYETIRPLPLPRSATLAELAALVAEEIGPVDALDFEGEMVIERRCASCRWSDAEARPLSTFDTGGGRCPGCGEVLTLSAGTSFTPQERISRLAIADLHLPDDDIVTVRSATNRQHFCIGSQE